MQRQELWGGRKGRPQTLAALWTRRLKEAVIKAERAC